MLPAHFSCWSLKTRVMQLQKVPSAIISFQKMLPQFLIIENVVTCDVTRGSAQEFRMVNYCVAFGCTSSSKDGISIFRFPKDMKLRSKWIQQVKRTGADSVLCSLHFTDDCFEASPSCYGIKKKAVLKKDAFLTIFKRPTTGTSSISTNKSRTVEINSTT